MEWFGYFRPNPKEPNQSRPNHSAGNKNHYAARLAFQASKGFLHPKAIVRHTCDNPKCVNPNHLVSGTHAQNVHDMMERGRAKFSENNPVGSMHGQSVLVEGQVVEIKRRLLGGEHYGALAREFGLSSGAMWCLANGKTWRHVNV